MAATPELLLPADGAVARLQSAIFSWEPVDGGADYYEVQVAADEAFQEIVASAESQETRAEVRLQPGALYFWRARAFSSGTPAVSSTYRSVSCPPMVPGIVSSHESEGLGRLLSQFREDG